MTSPNRYGLNRTECLLLAALQAAHPDGLTPRETHRAIGDPLLSDGSLFATLTLRRLGLAVTGACGVLTATIAGMAATFPTSVEGSVA